MDINRYEAFVAAVDTASMSGAAKKLGYTPSGIIRLINALEADLGFTVLTRSSTGVAPTEDGRRMLPLLRQMTELNQRAQQTSERIRGLAEGNLTIDALFSVAAHWLPRVIRCYQESFPGVKVNIVGGSDVALLDMLEQHAIDCALVHGGGHVLTESVAEAALAGAAKTCGGKSRRAKASSGARAGEDADADAEAAGANGEKSQQASASSRTGADAETAPADAAGGSAASAKRSATKAEAARAAADAISAAVEPTETPRASARAERMDFTPLGQQQLVAWVPASSKLAKQKSLLLAEMDGQPYIRIHPEGETFAERLMRQRNIEPDFRFTATDCYTAYSLVGAGLGCTLCCDGLTEQWKGAGRVAVRPLSPQRFMEFGVAVLPSSGHTPAVDEFVNVAKRFANSWARKSGAGR